MSVRQRSTTPRPRRRFSITDSDLNLSKQFYYLFNGLQGDTSDGHGDNATCAAAYFVHEGHMYVLNLKCAGGGVCKQRRKGKSRLQVARDGAPALYENVSALATERPCALGERGSAVQLQLKRLRGMWKQALRDLQSPQPVLPVLPEWVGNASSYQRHALARVRQAKLTVEENAHERNESKAAISLREYELSDSMEAGLRKVSELLKKSS
ncbi:hypothetical protein BC832DRAFT_541035 [Gaertneriomyces semiglobifer]|nr:hypothetical protein BC832DRAFT_541035 [Gaertneriomyces semiglobifer]